MRYRCVVLSDDQIRTAIARIVTEVEQCEGPTENLVYGQVWDDALSTIMENAAQLFIAADRNAAGQAMAQLLAAANDVPVPPPRVGAVAIHPKRGIIGAAYRGERVPGFDAGEGDHAEFNLLVKKLGLPREVPRLGDERPASTADGSPLSGCVLITSLEPCTPNVRSSNKISCVERIIHARPAKVMVGMLDPNREVTGQGIYLLQDAGIEVGLFNSAEVRELNADFVDYFNQRGSMALHAAEIAKTTSRLLVERELRHYRDNPGSEVGLTCFLGALLFNVASGIFEKQRRLEPHLAPPFGVEVGRGVVPTMEQLTEPDWVERSLALLGDG